MLAFAGVGAPQQRGTGIRGRRPTAAETAGTAAASYHGAGQGRGKRFCCSIPIIRREKFITGIN